MSALVTTLAGPAVATLARRPAAHGALAYAGATVSSPLSVAMMAFSTCVGVGYAGVVGAVALFVAVIVVAVVVSCSLRVRRVLDGHFDYRARSRREADRQRLLRASGPVRQHQYAEMRDLVADMERADPGDARRFELEELLDQFVVLVARHQRCLDWMRRAGGCDLPPAVAVDSPASKRRDLLERRIRHRAECVRRLSRLADDIEALDELVHLIAQRAACPADETEVSRDIERRVWELDEVDAALEQISA